MAEGRKILPLRQNINENEMKVNHAEALGCKCAPANPTDAGHIQAATAFLVLRYLLSHVSSRKKLLSGQEEITSKNKLKFNLRNVPSDYSIMKKEETRNTSAMWQAKNGACEQEEMV